MAERLIRRLIDDLDGTDIARGKGERVELTYRGITYRLDLCAANITKLEDALLPFLEVATKLPNTKSPRFQHAAAALTRDQTVALRKWARIHGYDVAARGRVRAEVIEAFIAAHVK